MLRKINLYKRQGQHCLLKGTQVREVEQVIGSSSEKHKGTSQITNNSIKTLLER